MTPRNLITLALLATVLCACSPPDYYHQDCSSQLACVNIFDREGFCTTVQAKDRLKQYDCIDFLSPQPYEKVLRTYTRDECGNNHAYITSYHDNGQLKQYLEVMNAGAHGAYTEHYENGKIKLEAHIVGGVADLTSEAESSWKFDGLCCVWDDSGNLQASFNYELGSLEGEALRYYPNGCIKQRTPYCRNIIHGCEEMFYCDGSPMASAHWCNGVPDGEASRQWESGVTASEEVFSRGRLLSGSYFDINGIPISEVAEGRGLRAIFGRNCVRELHEYRNGVQDGEVRILDNSGLTISVHHVKGDTKHGPETFYYPPTFEERSAPYEPPQRPQLLITWYEDNIHGTTKTWYPDGTQESQREMSNNTKNGVATAWYRDGSLMLMEEYERDKLIKGEYFRQGEKKAESRVIGGNGLATIYDSEGQLLHKIAYFHGFPLD